jgi:hypothetical protein
MFSFKNFGQVPNYNLDKKLIDQKFETTPEINLLAKVLFKSNYSYYRNITELLKKKGNNSYKELSKDFDIFNEFIEFNQPSFEISDSFIFMMVAEKLKVVKRTDWSGEYNVDDIKNLVNYSLPHNKINWARYNSLEETFLNPDTGYKNYQISPKGRFLLHQFDEIIKLIKPYNVNLFSINDGSDSFNLFILENKELIKIEKLMKFKSFGTIYVDSIEDLVKRSKKLKDWKNI